MKNYFVLNPAAGKGDKLNKTEEEIVSICDGAGVSYEIHRTTAYRDAEEYTRSILARGEGEEKRFYFCGGDGTLNEGVNALAGVPGVSCGVVPIGTGNDFSRNFDHRELFSDIRAQIEGEVLSCDLLRYGDRYCINMFNTGFDCRVVKYTAELKRNPLIPGKLAYIAGLVKALAGMPGVKARISYDGGEPEEVSSDMLLVCAGNGAFCGGGFKSAPYASLGDGLMDVCAVRRINRRTFLNLVGDYKRGTHVNEKTSNFLKYTACRTLTLEFDAPTDVCIDGELEKHSSLTMSTVSNLCSFIVPKGSVPIVNPAFVPLGCETHAGV